MPEPAVLEATEPQAPDGVDVDALVREIASAGTPDFAQSEDVKTPANPDPALTEGNSPPDGETPSVEQPAEGDRQTPQTAEAQTPETPAEPEAKQDESTPEEAPEGAPKADDPVVLNDRLGLSRVEEESVEELRARVEASSQEAHRLVDEKHAVEKFLDDQGLRLVQKADGQYGLLATEKYSSDLDVEAVGVGDVYDSLTDTEKALFGTDEQAACEVVAKKVAAKLHSLRPPVTAEPGDEVLPTTEVNKAFDDLIQAKMRDNQTPRFPDADKEQVQSLMRRLYDDDSLADFRKWMNRSSDNFYTGLTMLYGRTHMALAPVLAAKADAEQQRKQKDEKVKKDASVTASAAVEPEKAQRQAGVLTEEDMAREIAEAGYK